MEKAIMIVLQATDVRKALPMDETITAMKRAFAALSGGRARMPLRARLEFPPYEGESIFMPVFVDDTEGEEALAKIEELTGIQRSENRVREFLKSIGLSPRKVGTIPAKANPDEQESGLNVNIQFSWNASNN